MFQQNNFKKGFTLIELLAVIAIIGVLSSVVMSSLNSARKNARDTTRISEMEQIQKALEFYYDTYGRYPSSDNDGCGGWDVGNKTYRFIRNGTIGLGESMPNPPEDSIGTNNCSGYRYYRYTAAAARNLGCPYAKAFYVLGVTDMETSGRPHPNSPGFSCPSRDWQNEMDWVTGRFEGR